MIVGPRCGRSVFWLTRWRNGARRWESKKWSCADTPWAVWQFRRIRWRILIGVAGGNAISYAAVPFRNGVPRASFFPLLLRLSFRLLLARYEHFSLRCSSDVVARNARGRRCRIRQTSRFHRACFRHPLREEWGTRANIVNSGLMLVLMLFLIKSLCAVC